MAISGKYGQVATSLGAIGDDEPVFVLRAQDRLMPAVLEHYRALCEEAGSPARHLAGIDQAAEVVRDWQATHGTKTPSSDGLDDAR